MKKISIYLLNVALLITSLFFQTGRIYAEEPSVDKGIDTTGYTLISGVDSITQDDSIVTLSLKDGNKIRITFLDSDKFRYYVNIKDTTFLDVPKPNSTAHTGTIVVKPDAQHIQENKVVPTVTEGEIITIRTDKVTLEIDKATSKLTVKNKQGSVVMQEASPIMYNNTTTVQSLVERSDEYFFGGGTQNGRFSHKGKNIKIENTNNWVDGGVASPNPFYWSTSGYGVVRNTFKPGNYDFGAKTPGIVQTTHNENRYDAYITVAETPVDLLTQYTEITGKPAQLPEYAFYLSHLNCYNRDAWKPNSGSNIIDGVPYTETNRNGSVTAGELLESLLPKNGNDKVTAQRQIELHEELNLPLGSFLPNDGYGCGYGQTSTFEGDLNELRDFINYAKSKGVNTGLWTQSNLWPQDPNNPQKGERDFAKEVGYAGVSMVKTDVAWVGAGYSMALDGVKRAYEVLTGNGLKNNVVSLDGWAGTQRYAGIWSGDQTGGNWEYIRFHIPTYIGTGLSGQPYIGSDMDGIFGGKNPIVQTRDFQWKAFTPYMLDMDGWGSSQKNPWVFGEDNISINRAYLKLKAMMMPYVNTMSYASSQTGIPMVRAMFFEEMNPYTLGTSTQYQYMWGDSFLVAPIYQNTQMDTNGNDIRNDIYLPGNTDIWVDYFTGKQYRGGSVINNFDAPIWKTPVFVKNGSIIPMYPDNNNPNAITKTNPNGLDRTQRITEVYPYGESSFEAYEDDGVPFNGGSIRTPYTSSVKDGVATITIGKASGNYDGVVTNRSNEVIVNVSKVPTAVKGSVGEFTRVDSKEAYDNAIGNVYFYDESPINVVSRFATEGTTCDVNELTTTPKLYVKSTDKINIFENEFKVIVEGFANEAVLSNNTLNESLPVPQDVEASEVTDSTITLKWGKVDVATSYDVEIDGVVYSNIPSSTFTHHSLTFLTDYTYRIRSVSDNGYSNWSESITVKTADNPYRNVPSGISATYTGGTYSGKPDNVVDLDFSTQFHSSADADTSFFTMDLKKVYELDKLEYVPRQDNFGNGTLNQFILEYSVDGVHWKQAYKVGAGGDEAAWTYPQPSDVRFSHTIKFKNVVKAQYLRIKTLKSVGNFFTAFEVIPYAKDVTLGQIGGDYSNSGAIDEGDMTFLVNYSGIRDVDSDYDYVSMADVNFDGLIDAYDINYVTRQLEGGVKANNTNVSGKVMIVPNKQSAAAGDVVKYEVYGLGMNAVNAFSVELDLDTKVHRVLTNEPGAIAQNMQSFAKPRVHSDDSFNNYVTYANVGEQTRLSGTGVIATFEVEFLEAVDDTTLQLKTARFVGSNLSSVSGLEASEPSLPETYKILTLSDIESLKFINGVLTTDDGSNGSKLFQQSNYQALLFDGKKSELAEFKWFINESSFGPEVTLPTDFVIQLKKTEPVTTVNVYNRTGNGSNGRVGSIKAVAYNGSTAIDLGNFTTAQDVYEFKLDKPTMIDRIVITPLTSSGKTSFTNQPNENRMLSLREIEIITNSEVQAESVEATLPDSLFVGDLVKVDAKVLPTNATNGLYDVTSSDQNVVSIKRVVSETSYDFYLIPQSTGKATITITSKANPELKFEKEIEVISGVDTSVLSLSIEKAKAVERHLYTSESLEAMDVVLTESEAMLANPTSKEATLSKAMQLDTVVAKLVFKGSDSERPNSTNVIDSSKLSVHSYTNFADSDRPEHVIDNNKDTIWHTGYQSQHKLPVEIVIDLNDNVYLEQIDLLPSQRSRNGDITHYRVEVSVDGTAWTSVVEGLIANDGTQVLERDVAKAIKFAPVEARYVKVIAKATLGPANDKYASIAELTFYGISTTPIEAESLIFDTDTVEVMVGQSLTPSLTINPKDTTEVFTWTSSDESVATVENGVILGQGVGQAVITVQGAKASATLTVTVTPTTRELLEQEIERVETYLEEHEELHDFIKKQIQTTIDAAKAELANGEDDNLTTALNELLEAFKLVEENVHIIALQNYVNQDLSGFDADTTKAFAELQVKGQELLEAITTLDDVKALNAEFAKASESLVSLNKISLERLLEQAKSIDLSTLTEESKQALGSLVSEIEGQLDSLSTQRDIDALENRLATCIEELETLISDVTRKQLEDTLAMLKGLNRKHYNEKNLSSIDAMIERLEALLSKAEISESKASTLLGEVHADIDKLTTYIEKDFTGKPVVIKVGTKFTLYPDHDDQKGGNGWKYDATFFIATFNSPATFTAIKAGETTIEYTDLDGNVQVMKVIVEPSDEGTTPGGDTGSQGDLPHTGVQTITSLSYGAVILLVMGIILVSIKRRKQ